MLNTIFLVIETHHGIYHVSVLLTSDLNIFIESPTNLYLPEGGKPKAC